MTVYAEALIAESLSDEEVARLVEDFETIGLAVKLREVSPRRSMGDIAWFVLAFLPLQPFLSKVADDFATDAYKYLKSFVTRLLERGQNSSRTQRILVLQDTVTGVRIVLESDLPSESYQQLLRLDLSTLPQGTLRYDQHRKQWRTEQNGAAKTTLQPGPRSDP